MTAREIQVTFDCADPGALAEFWAVALGYQVQPPPPGFDTWDAALDAWGVPPDQRNERSAVVPPTGEPGPRLFFQRVPEGKVAKNRVHLDVRAAPGVEGEARMQCSKRSATSSSAGAPAGFSASSRAGSTPATSSWQIPRATSSASIEDLARAVASGMERSPRDILRRNDTGSDVSITLLQDSSVDIARLEGRPLRPEQVFEMSLDAAEAAQQAASPRT